MATTELERIKTYLPENCDLERIEKGIALMQKIKQDLSKERLDIKLVVGDNNSAFNLIKHGGEWAMVPLAFIFAKSLEAYLISNKLDRLQIENLFEIANIIIINNKWLTMKDIVFFMRGLTFGSFQIENGITVEFPTNYNKFTLVWLNQCVNIFWDEKKKAQAFAVKEAERIERANYPKVPTAPPPEIQESLNNLKGQWMEAIIKGTDGKAAEIQEKSTFKSDFDLREWVMKNVMRFEIHTIREKRYAFKKQGEIRIVEMIDTLLNEQERQELHI